MELNDEIGENQIGYFTWDTAVQIVAMLEIYLKSIEKATHYERSEAIHAMF